MSTSCLFGRSFLTCISTGYALLSLSFLGGCADDTPASAFAPACPQFDVPSSIADRFIYNDKGIDISNQISHTQILTINGDCREGPKDSHQRPLTRVRLSLSLQQERGPAATNTFDNISYFVAIMQDGRIVDKKIFTDKLKTSPQQNIYHIKTPLKFIDIPTGKNPQISPYVFEIGFQLSRKELKYNKQHMPQIGQFKSHIQ